MSLRLADRLMDHASAVMPPGRSEWAGAMRAEYSCLRGEPEALGWAWGCVWACYVERINPREVFHKSLLRAGAVWLLLFSGFAIQLALHPHRYFTAFFMHQALRKLTMYYAWLFVALWLAELLIARFWASPKKLVQKSLARAAAVWLWPLALMILQLTRAMTNPRLSHLMSSGEILRRILGGFAQWGSVAYVVIFIPLLICELVVTRRKL